MKTGHSRVAPRLVAVGGPERVADSLRQVLLDGLGATAAPLSGPEMADLVERIDDLIETTVYDTLVDLERDADDILLGSPQSLEDKLLQGRTRASCGIF